MNFTIEVTEAEVKNSVAAEISRRVRDRIPYNSAHIQMTADAKIRETTTEVVAELDIRELVRQEVQSALDSILKDTVRHQVKSIVRLAVQRELAAQKAEFQEPAG